MRRAFFLMLTGLLTACAGELARGLGDASDANAKTAALPEGTGVLGADFEADRIAPARAAGTAGHEHHHGAASPSAEPTSYTCSHHPEVASTSPGKCPKCGMDLVPTKPAPGEANPHEGH